MPSIISRTYSWPRLNSFLSAEGGTRMDLYAMIEQHGETCVYCRAVNCLYSFDVPGFSDGSKEPAPRAVNGKLGRQAVNHLGTSGVAGRNSSSVSRVISVILIS
jgi:hypothetical protein